MRWRSALLTASLLLAVAQSGWGQDGFYVVTNTNDSGLGSLRQAIIEANGDRVDSEIDFRVSGTGLRVIRPLTPLPALAANTTLNGQLSSTSEPAVEISGATAGGGNGLELNGSGCVIRNLQIVGWERGIQINASGCTVIGCHIGTASVGNSYGIFIGQTADESVIGGSLAGQGNVISGNTEFGIIINDFQSAGTRVIGNKIGTDASGMQEAPNGTGLWSIGETIVVGGSDPGAGNLISGNRDTGADVRGGVVRGNVVGLAADGLTPLPNRVGIRAAFSVVGGDPPSRNVISGNSETGLALISGDSHVVGNFIGTDVTGTRDVGNGGSGISTVADRDTITGNVISGNSLRGITMSSANLNVIEGNRIGTDVTGTVALPNQTGGILLGGENNLIGGQTPETRNVISGNGGPGIEVDGGFLFRINNLRGNWIGVDVTGVRPLGNQGHGMWIRGSGTRVGGPNPSEGNVISSNSGHGVLIERNNDVLIQSNIIGLGADGRTPVGNHGDGVRNLDASFVTVHGNAISHNGGLGIDLGGDGFTQNDPGDGDTGPNDLQNAPFAMGDFGVVPPVFNGGLSSTPNASFTIEIFLSESPDPIRGEGAAPVMSLPLVTDGTGAAFFQQPFNGTLPAGRYVTATATDSAGRTSEFSVAFRAASSEPTSLEILDFLLGLIPDPGDLNVNDDEQVDVADAIFQMFN